MNRFVWLFLIIFNLFQVKAQNIALTSFPHNNQLYKRNLATNIATIVINATTNSTSGFSFVTLEVYRNNILHNSYNTTLTYNNGIAPINFSVPIIAELAQYKFVLKGNGNAILAEADNVVAGDIYIVTGQSNSVWDNFNYIAPTLNPFVRTFNESYVWQATYDLGGIGFWFANTLVNTLQIPVAVFKSGEAGRPIDYFQRNDNNPFDLTTNYGRLLTRFNYAGFTSSDVRAIIWYQGESDGLQTETYYTNLFTSLYSDWTENYSPERYYVFQIRKGCYPFVTDTSDIPEAQRKLPLLFNNLKVIATNATPQGSDGCHYTNTDGYNQLALRLFNVINYELYNNGASSGIYSPNITNVRFSDLTKTQVKFNLLPANDIYNWQSGSQNYFNVNGIAATNGSIVGNEVTLELSQPILSNTSVLNFMGAAPQATPFIVNQNGIGLLSFKNVQVNKQFTAINDGSWTYYYASNDLTKPLFGIEKNPIGSGANTNALNINVDISDGNAVYAKNNSLNGTFALQRTWNLNTTNLPNGWINIKIFYSTTYRNALHYVTDQFSTTTPTGQKSGLLHIQSSSHFNPIENLVANGINIPIKSASINPNSGIYNGEEYRLLNNVVLESYATGFGVLQRVANVLPAGLIRFNTTLQKFQGYNGVTWESFH